MSKRFRHPTTRATAAVVLALVVALAGCSSSSGTQLSGGELRSDGSGASSGASEADQPPDLLAEKEIPTGCATELGTGDPAFEAAFCAYRDAALAATSGPDGIAGIDPALLSAGDDALALFADDPAGALALLQSATDGLAG